MPILDFVKLDARASCFKLAMHNNNAQTLQEPLTENPLSKLWKKLNMNPVIANKYSEFMRMAELNVVQMLGNAEGESTFFTLSFLKSKLKKPLANNPFGLVCTFVLSAIPQAPNLLVPRSHRGLETNEDRNGGEAQSGSNSGRASFMLPRLSLQCDNAIFVIIWHVKRIWWAF